MREENHKQWELTERLIGIYFEIYNELGYGFLECIYEEAFTLLLKERQIPFTRQSAFDVKFRGAVLGQFRADLIADSAVIVEFKAAQKIDAAHEKQLLNYLKATTLEVGLIFNFGPSSQFRRIIFDNERKTSFKTRSIAASSSH